ncbi:putative short-chain dehydrogenase [Auricularia subglabra TFB-10046 SS5]|uniref:Putative short-chain dehydrogenase n=1 Tax=Auricularia subglabra (strain TFB-10046 / SS5) TaxID=717982 RepID=J0D9A5_AURST|nr:putative short-chain dehydrogenase [Auricularia subglabra TFB-10046 SS5]
MPSYVVAGASRGIGLEFVAQLAARPDGTVFALSRNPDKSHELQELQTKSSNVHVIKADITDPTALENAAAQVQAATGGALDMLVINAIYVSETTSFAAIDEYSSTDALLQDFRTSFETNVIGYVLATNAFLPLLKKGTLKKVLALGSGMADPALVLRAGYAYGPAYGVSKMALEMAMVKYAVKYKKDGFVFLTVSPGMVQKTNADFANITPEVMTKLQEMRTTFRALYPASPGPLSASDAARMVLSVMDNATPEDSGKFFSHKGDKAWL